MFLTFFQSIAENLSLSNKKVDITEPDGAPEPKTQRTPKQLLKII